MNKNKFLKNQNLFQNNKDKFNKKHKVKLMYKKIKEKE